MSDFFTRLAARTLEVAPTVRPRIAPLFAQGPAMPSQDQHGSGDESALTPFDGAAGAHRGGLASVLSHPEADLSSSAPMDALYAAATAPPHDVAATGPRPLQHGDVASPPPLASVARAADAAAIFRRPTPPTDPLSDRPPGGDVGIGPARHRRGVDAKPMPSVEAQRRHVGEGSEAEEEAAAPPKAHLGRPVPMAVGHRPQLTPSPASSAPAPVDRHEEPQTPTPDAPIIRVTIGRIEVRAIMPPAPAPPRQPPSRPAPRLSLEEYLHQRREGRR
jgi:hypothetical protein